MAQGLKLASMMQPAGSAMLSVSCNALLAAGGVKLMEERAKESLLPGWLACAALNGDVLLSSALGVAAQVEQANKLSRRQR